MRLGISTLLIAALATASLVGCGDSDTGSGGGGGAGGGATGTGGDDTGAGGDDTGAGGGAGGGGDEACTASVVADPDTECAASCDAAFSNADDSFNLCTVTCESDADCNTEETDLICDGALGACVYSCGADAPGCPTSGSWICDDAETGAGTLLCIPDGLSD